MRTYKRKAGSRPYATSYAGATIHAAVLKISAGMSILKASKKYNIPYGTLYNRVHHLHTKNVGAPFRLTDETEQLIVNAVNAMTQWKVPLDGLDIRCLVKSYLDKQGVQRQEIYQELTRKRLVAEFYGEA
jgi:helix-turn-helix, Psq domain